LKRSVLRERLKEVREKERTAKLAKKERQKAARDAQKAIQLSPKGKRKALKAHKPPIKRQKHGGAGAARGEAPSAVIAAPAQKTATRLIQKPKKYSK
jgi:hypothetical protein